MDASEIEMESLIDNCAKVMSAADEPIIISKQYEKNKLLNFSLMTRKGERSALMAQNTEDMNKFCEQLLEIVDEKVSPKNDDDHIGGKYYRAQPSSNIYCFKNLHFQLDPNRSWTYLETLKEETAFMSQRQNKYNAVCAALDTLCENKGKCFYKTLFFPQINRPGPVILPETLVELITLKKHDLNPNGLIDLFDHIYEYLECIILNNEKQTNVKTNKESEFEKPKFYQNYCVCCLFVQQSHIQLDAINGHWKIKGIGDSSDVPLETIQLIGYELFFDNDIIQSMDCFSNVIDINGTKMTSLVRFPFEYFDIVPIKGMNKKYEVLTKKPKT